MQKFYLSLLLAVVYVNNLVNAADVCDSCPWYCSKCFGDKQELISAFGGADVCDNCPSYCSKCYEAQQEAIISAFSTANVCDSCPWYCSKCFSAEKTESISAFGGADVCDNCPSYCSKCYEAEQMKLSNDGGSVNVCDQCANWPWYCYKCPSSDAEQMGLSEEASGNVCDSCVGYPSYCSRCSLKAQQMKLNRDEGIISGVNNGDDVYSVMNGVWIKAIGLVVIVSLCLLYRYCAGYIKVDKKFATEEFEDV